LIRNILTMCVWWRWQVEEAQAKGMQWAEDRSARTAAAHGHAQQAEQWLQTCARGVRLRLGLLQGWLDSKQQQQQLQQEALQKPGQLDPAGMKQPYHATVLAVLAFPVRSSFGTAFSTSFGA
jgi:hypothetical protein